MLELESGKKNGVFSPTDLFTRLELQNPSHDAHELHKISRSPDCDVLKFLKGPAGYRTIPYNPVTEKASLENDIYSTANIYPTSMYLSRF